MEGAAADENGLKKAVKVLRNGGVVVYPTDTLYGVGVALSQPKAILKVFELKRMDPAPLSIVMSGIEMIKEYTMLSGLVLGFFEIFPAGPFTFFLPLREERKKDFPDFMIKEGLVGVRVPVHAIPRRLTECVGPVTSTSANLHGAIPPRNFMEVSLEGADLYLDDGPCLYGRGSTILKEEKGNLRILREGALEYSVIKKYLGEYIG
ncbi:MAG: threonylcarbamoyl-AMP synthase [Thermoplasmata archaeon]|nr:threonylcarbamoyl-AMP synthase [Thermoplasmata archaeon]